MFSRVDLVYLLNGQKRRFHLKDNTTAEAALEIDNSAGFKWGQAVSVNLSSREPVELVDFRLELAPGLAESGQMMANGFQSWSRSGALGAGERIASPPRLAYPLLASYGDYRLYRYSGRRGRLHSWTYTYFSLPGGGVLFLGSLDESAGYTLFEYDYYRDRLVIHRDCAGAAVREGYPLLRLYLGRGSLEQVLDEYFARLKVSRRLSPRATGWTSRTRGQPGITGPGIEQNLDALCRLKLPLDYFQVGEGWQRCVGDWMEQGEQIPSGMKALAGRIRTGGFRPGLWLAPFICERGSRVFQEHSGWLLRNARGKPVRAGYNRLWGGWFYALDFYAPGFQEYLSRVLETALGEWGFEMLELDYLYAAALLPRNGKPRGRVMTEVMDFINRQAGESKLLGSGVPLGPAMKRVDFCRVAGDAAPFWESSMKGLNSRERASTLNSLAGAMGRLHLDRRAFRIATGVFLLGDGAPGMHENRLAPHQRHTLFFLNILLGGMVLFPDEVEAYTPAQLALLRSGFPNLETRVRRVEENKGLYRLEFSTDKKQYLAFVNLTGSPRSFTLEEGPYFHPELFVLRGGRTLQLEPFQTLCFYRIEPREDKGYLLGGTDHLYPGAQVEKLIVRTHSATLKLHEHASPQSKVLLAVPRGVINLQVNKVNYPVTLKDRVHFITVPYQGDSVPLDPAPGVQFGAAR